MRERSGACSKAEVNQFGLVYTCGLHLMQGITVKGARPLFGWTQTGTFRANRG